MATSNSATETQPGTSSTLAPLSAADFNSSSFLIDVLGLSPSSITSKGSTSTGSAGVVKTYQVIGICLTVLQGPWKLWAILVVDPLVMVWGTLIHNRGSSWDTSRSQLGFLGFFKLSVDLIGLSILVFHYFWCHLGIILLDLGLSQFTYR